MKLRFLIFVFSAAALLALTGCALPLSPAGASERYEVTFHKERAVVVDLTASERCPRAAVPTSSPGSDGKPLGSVYLFRYCGEDKSRMGRLYGNLSMRSFGFTHLEGQFGSIDWPTEQLSIQQQFAADLPVGGRLEVRDQSSGTVLVAIRRVE